MVIKTNSLRLHGHRIHNSSVLTAGSGTIGPENKDLKTDKLMKIDKIAAEHDR